MKRIKKVFHRHKKVIIIAVAILLIGGLVTYFIVKPKPYKVTQEEQKNIIKMNQAELGEVDVANYKELQQIERLAQEQKWDEAKQRLDSYKSVHTKLGTEKELLNTLSASICLQVADLECLDAVLVSYKELEDKARFIVLSVQVANLAKQKNQTTQAKNYFVKVKEVVDSLGGEAYIKSLIDRDKEGGFNITYTSIVEGAK